MKRVSMLPLDAHAPFLGGRNLDTVPASEQSQLLHSPLCYCFSLTSVSDFGYSLLLLLLEEEVRSPWDDDLVHVTYWFLLEVTSALDNDLVHVIYWFLLEVTSALDDDLVHLMYGFLVEVTFALDDDLVHVIYWFLLEVTFALDDDLVHVTLVLAGGNICIGR